MEQSNLFLFVFNRGGHQSDWTTEHAAVVVASSEQEAIERYRQVKHISDESFRVVSYPIEDGLVLDCFGYDVAEVDVVLPDDTVIRSVQQDG